MDLRKRLQEASVKDRQVDYAKHAIEVLEKRSLTPERLDEIKELTAILGENLAYRTVAKALLNSGVDLASLESLIVEIERDRTALINRSCMVEL